MHSSFKKVSDSETILTELMIPSYSNFGGKVHGGILLSLMDKVAYVTAVKHCGNYAVTVAVEGVEFLNPVEVGELVSLKASVNYVGRTSLIIGMRIEALNPKTGVVKHTNSCYFTMAAKNENGELVEAPGIILENGEQIRRFAEGMAIKKLSKEKRKILKSDFLHLSQDEVIESIGQEKCQIILT
jgi:acyl-CoA hydrolase